MLRNYRNTSYYLIIITVLLFASKVAYTGLTCFDLESSLNS